MAHTNEHDEEVGRRRSKRALFRAEVNFGHKGRRCRVTILDISLHGLKIRAIHKLELGDEFWLKLPGLAPISAKVSWVRDFVLGCEFRESLHPAMFEAILDGRVFEEAGPDRRVKARAANSHLIAI